MEVRLAAVCRHRSDCVPLFKQRNLLHQYSRRKKSSMPTVAEVLRSPIPESEVLVNLTGNGKQISATQSAASVSSLKASERSPHIRKYFSRHGNDNYINIRSPSIGSQKIRKIGTGLSGRRLDLGSKSQDGMSQMDTIDATEERKVDTDSVPPRATERSQPEKLPGPSFPTNTAVGASPRTPKPEDRPGDLACGSLEWRNPRESPLGVHKPMVRTTQKTRRRHYTTSCVGKQVIWYSIRVKLILEAFMLSITEHSTRYHTEP